MTSLRTIAVLGLGHMGGAMAMRLGGQGWNVLGWTRSGRGTSGAITPAADAREAVAKADVVLLSLFDGPACREVVDAVDGSLRPDTVVVNTSTIAPAEAAELARRLGRAYLHAPVLGSVPAVNAGALTLLVAGHEDALGRARPVLDALGTVRRVEDAGTAAALKLVANHSLAGALLALRDALHQADALHLDRAQALDVLALGRLGALVTGKRPFLAGPAGTSAAKAEFTVGALAKDMAVLAAASGTPVRSAAALLHSPAGPTADIAAVATVPRVEDAVLEPLRAYVRGHATGDPAHFRNAFLPGAHVEGIRGGRFVSWELDEYCSLFSGWPAPDEATRTRRIESVDVHGTVAAATMTLVHGAQTFTDVFLLVLADGRWRIANKVYHRHPSGSAAPA